MQQSDKPAPFTQAGFYFLGILLVTITGFLIPFMSTWSDPTISHPPVIHVHAGMMSLWLAIMIAQPFLIRLGWNRAHHVIGKSTYVIFPILCLGIIHLTVTSLPGLPPTEQPTFLAVQLMDFVLLVGCVFLGLFYRHHPEIHSRFIIGSALPMTEPGLTRTFMAILPNADMLARSLSLGLLLFILLVLLFKDWHRHHLRWVFGSVFLSTFFFSLLILFGDAWPLWYFLVDWFVTS